VVDPAAGTWLSGPTNQPGPGTHTPSAGLADVSPPLFIQPALPSAIHADHIVT
jgi:hypothetical protein